MDKTNNNSITEQPVIGITMGDSAGIGPEVIVKSVYGILKIGSPNYVKSEEREPEMEVDEGLPKSAMQSVEIPPSPNSQMKILQQIESGEISVEEALQQLYP